MREILFRGKRIDNGKWAYGYYFYDSFYSKAYITAGRYCMTPRERKPNQRLINAFEVDQKTIGQYTGLTDKNGIKIFEGDIIRVKSFDWDYEYTTKVYCYSHTLCVDIYRAYNQTYDYTSIGFANYIWDEENCVVEVIGNIYDNPELLKKE